MFSNFIKYILTALNFSPILVVFQLVQIIPKLIGNKDTIIGISDFLPFLVFLLCIVIYWIILALAQKSLSNYPIEVKSIKNVDMNINPMFLSYFLPLAKPLQFKENNDILILSTIFIAFVAITIISNTSFQYSPILRLCFRLKHYEVQTEEGLYLIVLSKDTLINKNQITSGIKLSECLVLKSI